jgi:GDP-L-fucose synthase
VVPSLLRKFAEAVKFELNSVKIWGTGTPMREFIYAKDVANAVIRLTQSDVYLKEPFIVNLGSGQEVSIRELAEILKDISGFTGEVIFDSSFPDGVNQKTLDSSLLGSTGFRPEFELRDGLKLTYDWVVNNFENLRISEVAE